MLDGLPVRVPDQWYLSEALPSHEGNDAIVAALYTLRGHGAAGITCLRSADRRTGLYSSPSHVRGLNGALLSPLWMCDDEGHALRPSLTARRQRHNHWNSTGAHVYLHGRSGGPDRSRGQPHPCKLTVVLQYHAKRSGVDPPLGSSRACLHTAFIANSVRCVPQNTKMVVHRTWSKALDALVTFHVFVHPKRCRISVGRTLF